MYQLFHRMHRCQAHDYIQYLSLRVGASEYSRDITIRYNLHWDYRYSLLMTAHRDPAWYSIAERVVLSESAVSYRAPSDSGVLKSGSVHLKADSHHHLLWFSHHHLDLLHHHSDSSYSPRIVLYTVRIADMLQRVPYLSFSRFHRYYSLRYIIPFTVLVHSMHSGWHRSIEHSQSYHYYLIKDHSFKIMKACYNGR